VRVASFEVEQCTHDPAWWRVGRRGDGLGVVLVASVGDSTPHCRLTGPIGGTQLADAAKLRHEADRLLAAAELLEQWQLEHADPATHGRLL
jgi:hypothetical protein